MQRSFDLFTRPPLHMKILVDTEKQFRNITSSSMLLDNPQVLLERLRLAYWVADHRVTHGKYVMAFIYQTQPVGGQSRASGTGGSTPPFLKLFLDQTIQPGRSFIIQLLLNQNQNQLTSHEQEEVAWYAHKFDEFELTMDKIRNKGQELEFEEKQQQQQQIA